MWPIFLFVFVGQRHWVMDFWWQFFSISKQFLSTLRFQGELALGFQNMTSVMLVCRLYSHSASALKPLAWAILLLLQQFYFYISEREKRRRLCDYYNGSFTSILLKLQLTLFSRDSQLWHRLCVDNLISVVRAFGDSCPPWHVFQLKLLYLQ